VHVIRTIAGMRDISFFDLFFDSSPSQNTDRISSMIPTPELTPELFSDIFDTNVRGPVHLTKAALQFISRGARIIPHSSIAASQELLGAPLPLYAATKAVESLARS
jgi:NAD(P)-dependent dehydrogenase (short-subunit alcohol dehydrogenase family)